MNKFNKNLEKKIMDFLAKKPLDSPKMIECSCGARFSYKLHRCPKCGLVHESEIEKKNWSEM